MVFGRSNFWGMAIWMRRGDHFWGGGGAILRRRGDFEEERRSLPNQYKLI
jgi:hypothetical protein